MEAMYTEHHDKLRINFLMHNLTAELYNKILDARVNVEAKWQKDTKEKRNANYSILKKYLWDVVKADYKLECIYKTTDITYGRRYCTPSTQSIAREIRTFLMPGCIDLDIENCWFNIIHKICIDKGFDCKQLKMYTSDRDSFIKKIFEEETGTTVKECEFTFCRIKASLKQKIINTLTSSKTQHSNSMTFKSFDKEMKIIQNNLINCKFYTFITASDEKNNYNGSFASHVCQYHENLIIQSAERYLQENGISICGLMFDGLLVYSSDFNLNLFNEYICKEIGYPFNFVIKKHKCVFPEFQEWIYKDVVQNKDKPDEIIYREFLIWAERNNLARLKYTEFILKRMDMNWGKRIYSDANECINEFIRDTNFIESFFLCAKAKSYKSMLTDFITSGQPNVMFPCVSKNWRYYSFKNGIFDIVQNQLIAKLNPEILCNNRFEQDYTSVKCMPEELIRIFSHQKWTSETMDIYCGLMGRLFFPLNELDQYGIVTCNKGVSSTGKSSVLERICDIVDNYKTLNARAHNFSLEGCDKTKLIYVGEAENLPKMLDIEDFKKMARGETININIKNKTAIDTTITAPLALVANEIIEYPDSSDAIKNRICYFMHDKKVTDPDGNLKIKMKSMNHTFLSYFTYMYHKLLNISPANIKLSPQLENWGADTFEEQNDFLSWLNMLHADLYWQVKPVEGEICKAKDLTDKWKLHWEKGLKKKLPAPKISSNQDAELELFGIEVNYQIFCRHCEKPHRSGCCDKYDRTHKKKLKVYKNCQLVQGGLNRRVNYENNDPE
jgi:hypothetical protein